MMSVPYGHGAVDHGAEVGQKRKLAHPNSGRLQRPLWFRKQPLLSDCCHLFELASTDEHATS